MLLPTNALPTALPVRDGIGPDEWLQAGVELAAPPSRRLYADLAVTVQEMLQNAVISEFFFMHKTPGLRLRFAAAPGNADQVRTEVVDHIRRWRLAGLIADARFTVYEPEAHLFGGPASMRHVHGLFTVDSLSWLEFHAEPDQAPAWALSMLMLREVFAGLRIVGWEHRDAWARVAATGRVLANGTQSIATGSIATGSIATGPIDTGNAPVRLRELWDHPGRLAAALPEAVRAIADRHAELVSPLLSRWWTEYFLSGRAMLGPRQAAAHYVVFHWNRAALGPGRQILITESLAKVDGADDER